MAVLFRDKYLMIQFTCLVRSLKPLIVAQETGPSHIHFQNLYQVTKSDSTTPVRKPALSSNSHLSRQQQQQQQQQQSSEEERPDCLEV